MVVYLVVSRGGSEIGDSMGEVKNLRWRVVWDGVGMSFTNVTVSE